MSFVKFAESLSHLLSCEGQEASDPTAAAFLALDLDGDGKISASDLEAAIEPVMTRGRKEDEEKERERTGEMVALAALRKHDADGDGCLSALEFRSLLGAAGSLVNK